MTMGTYFDFVIKVTFVEFVGKIVSGQLFYPVFQHVTYYKCNEHGHGEEAIFVLKGEGNDCGKYHGQSCGKAIEDLFNPYAVLAFFYIEIEVCLLYTSPSPRDGLLSR